MTHESTCPRCGAMLTSGGCLSCGYPNGSLRERTAADTVLAGKSKGDAQLGHVRIEALIESFENLAYVRQRLADAEAERDEARRELAEARQYGPKWWPSEEEVEDGWEETEFYDNDFSHVLIFVVPPAPSVRRALARKGGKDA